MCGEFYGGIKWVLDLESICPKGKMESIRPYAKILIAKGKRVSIAHQIDLVT
jgi:hypothetical protein